MVYIYFLYRPIDLESDPALILERENVSVDDVDETFDIGESDDEDDETLQVHKLIKAVMIMSKSPCTLEHH